MTIELNGILLAEKQHQQIKSEVEALQKKHGRRPGLAVILVGENPASQAYVARKERVAKNSCGFESFDLRLTETVSYEDLLKAIQTFNNDPKVDGILLQLPLPKHLNSNTLIQAIDPKKDADGLHPLNQGLLQQGTAKLIPCTPLGIMKLIDLAYYLSEHPDQTENYNLENISKKDLTGKTAVVIGRSILVGKPVATLLLERNATVEIVHSRTQNIKEHCARADILVAAVGQEQLVKSDWVKPSAIVIDVGINRIATGELVGDVDYEQVAEKTLAITPVPGGAGPMTVAMLMRNTLEAYKINFKN